MKRTVLLLTVLMTILGLGARAEQAAVPAAAPATGAADQGAGRGGRGGGAAAPNPAATSNERAGVNIDRFMGDPTNTPAHLSHGGLLTHTILRAGDPYTPGASTAVLEYRKELATATLAPRNKTMLTALPDQYMFYVTSGQGRLDDGTQFWDLREGVAALIPPGVQRRFTTTSAEPLTMVMNVWTPAAPPRADILVRDTSMLPYCEENAHWNNFSKCIFGSADGLFRNERFYLVLLPPWAMSEPHMHGEGTEEVWTKLSPGRAVVLLGSEIREMEQHSAYLVPPTGVTQHANLNLSKGDTQAWLYMARGRDNPTPAPAPAGRAGGGGGGGRGGNPNLITGNAGSVLGTVPGQPLR